MNREELYESIGDIDEDLLERSEKAAAVGKRRWRVLLPMAACFGAVLLSAALLGKSFFTVEPGMPEETAEPLSQPSGTVQPAAEATSEPAEPTAVTEPVREPVPTVDPDSWEAVYNEQGSGLSALIMAPFGYFTEHMNQEQIKLLLPGVLQERTDITGIAHYEAGNELWYAVIWVPLRDVGVHVLYKEYPTCVLSDGLQGTVSVCGDVEYYIMEKTIERRKTREVYVPTETEGIYEVKKVKTDEMETVTVGLEAWATINGVPMFFLMDVSSWNVESDKQIFKEVLTAFAACGEGEPSVEELFPQEPQNAYLYDYTMEEALGDKTFGDYLPRRLPENGSVVSAKRYYEEKTNTDKLELRIASEDGWVLSWVAEKSDSPAAQLPTREKVEESVRQLTDGVDVDYGDVSVHLWHDYLREDDLDTYDYQWLYEQLTALAWMKKHGDAAVPLPPATSGCPTRAEAVCR